MKRRRNNIRRTVKVINTPYVIDRSSVIKIFETIDLDDRIIFNLKNVQFISRAASHEFLKHIDDKFVTLVNSKHLLVSQRSIILDSTKSTNIFHVVKNKDKNAYRESLSKISYY